jgi:hypothetical protein
VSTPFEPALLAKVPKRSELKHDWQGRSSELVKLAKGANSAVPPDRNLQGRLVDIACPNALITK